MGDIVEYDRGIILFTRAGGSDAGSRKFTQINVISRLGKDIIDEDRICNQVLSTINNSHNPISGKPWVHPAIGPLFTECNEEYNYLICSFNYKSGTDPRIGIQILFYKLGVEIDSYFCLEDIFEMRTNPNINDIRKKWETFFVSDLLALDKINKFYEEICDIIGV